MKLFTIAALVLAFTVSAQAQKRTKAPGTRVSKQTQTERSYTTTSNNSYSYGGSFTHEIFFNLTGSRSGGSYLSFKEHKDGDTATVLDVGGTYLRYWKDNMQYGVEARFRSLSKEASASQKSATLFDALGVGVYNLNSDLDDSIYAKAGFGLYSVLNDDGDGYENKFGFFLGAGKRFALFNNVAYAPELRLVKRGDIDMAIQIDFLNASLHW
ncbi:hypothetical protein [Bdellovibrio reynosensis]|uniref:Outer membrane protein beta-barrel domain-containing protein n=1 Tax=Bdellovibrio reynosensis TaxID=2835041 RepID=A0ABY4C805_9BACT|nr:hypothetical protein [Bdellovibrio reynosensis]UOF00919.1 hypothetical protein MNR06_14550 [Bdellovibrio reynosensis]